MHDRGVADHWKGQVVGTTQCTQNTDKVQLPCSQGESAQPPCVSFTLKVREEEVSRSSVAVAV